FERLQRMEQMLRDQIANFTTSDRLSRDELYERRGDEHRDEREPGVNLGEFARGQPVPRFEDPRLLRGGGRYVDDMALPRQAYGHVLRSPHGHARIRAIDTSRAKAAPGVLAVLTGADWRQSGW